MKRILLFLIFSGICLQGFSQWSIENFTKKRWYHASAFVEGKLIVAGGLINGLAPINSVEILDTETGEWKTAELTVPRGHINAAVNGTKAYFVGGGDFSGGISDRVDVYDAVTDLWTAFTLKEARADITVQSYGDSLIFAGGGIIGPGNSYRPTDRIEIYNTQTREITELKMEFPRMGMGSAIAGDRLFLAGGVVGITGSSTSFVEILNLKTGERSSTNLPEEKSYVAVEKVGDYIVFVGGLVLDSDEFKSVDIYNHVTDTWINHSFELPEPRGFIASGVIGDKAYFAGGTSVENRSVDQVYKDIFIFDASTQTWSRDTLSDIKTGMSATEGDGCVYFSGGFNWQVGLNNDVEIFCDPDFVSTNETSFPETSLSVFPNPTSGSINFDFPATSGEIEKAEIFNLLGQKVFSKIKPDGNDLDVSEVPPGTYFLTLFEKNGKRISTKFIKE